MNEAVHRHKKTDQTMLSVVAELLHGAKVSNMSYLIGRQMAMTKEECHDLAVAGFLHDIGKLELAKYVRAKETKTLTIEEMRYVRAHSNLSAMILREKGYSQSVVDMVKYHHENCDGSGYPQNLIREDIPMGARILRVADVFSALTSDRPYRSALDVETTVKLMIEESKYYDVKVFLAFLQVVNGPDISRVMDNDGLEQSLLEFSRDWENSCFDTSDVSDID
jgi:putative nucleotidyltransferase with HDIG domain